MPKPSTCHPDKPMLAKGLCSACYARAWAEANPERLRERRQKRQAEGPRAACHPDRPVLAQGLCQTCYRQQWREDPGNRDREREWQRASKRRSYPRRARAIMLGRYGLTVEAYDRLLESQGGRCAVCPATERLQVDHCHARGVVRAILCAGCNSALGHAQDDPVRLRALADYVEAATGVG